MKVHETTLLHRGKGICEGIGSGDEAISSQRRHRGFTFIEVLVAMLIFTLAVLAAVSIAEGAVRATREAKELTTATWLLQNTMVDLETKLESEGVDKACIKKKDGKFEAPYETFSYTTECYAIDFHLSEAAAKLTGKNKSDSGDSDTISQENVILKMVLGVASNYITQSSRELHVTVSWLHNKAKRTIDATTHFVRYDQPVQMTATNQGLPNQ